MQNSYYSILLVLCFQAGVSQSIYWSATNKIGSYPTQIDKIATDVSGNVYVVGKYEVAASKHIPDVRWFLAQFDTTGNQIWQKTLTDRAVSMCINRSNQKVVLVGQDSLGCNLTVYNSNGTVNQRTTIITKLGGLLKAEIRDVATDTLGNVFICGVYRDTLNIGASQFTHLKSESHLFTAKLNSAATVQWVHTTTGGHVFLRSTLAVDKIGNCFIGGDFMGTLKLGNDSIKHLGFSDGFLYKLSPGGVLRWLNHFQGPVQEFVSDIATDNNGDVFITGFHDQQFIQAVTPIESNESIAGNIFVAKFDSTGANVWGKSYGAANPDIPGEILLDGGGGLYLTGSFMLSTTIGTISASSESNVGEKLEGIVAHIGSTGSVAWLVTNSTDEDSFSANNSCAGYGNFLYVGGGYNGSVGLGSYPQSSVGNTAHLFKISK